MDQHKQTAKTGLIFLASTPLNGNQVSAFQTFVNLIGDISEGRLTCATPHDMAVAAQNAADTALREHIEATLRCEQPTSHTDA